ncbi:CCA tRNA nucleotidyltransferase [Anaeromyxobacter paludicola]|uniref:HDIG domain-containing protein n=1 Tax=Anaeromyxobacter paludicola TaxID=2918171 RepID=A0ABM7X7Q5_9BACT|nr:tRNA cytidylyltransferase [Anaeromyxobacter paludicola]BDG07871.1 HDIG domain-containing protein [Anaeromyxobacter paludicola]
MEKGRPRPASPPAATGRGEPGARRGGPSALEAGLPRELARAHLPLPVLDVLRRLDSAGHRSWLVGGAVRDLLLGRRRATADFDVATPARPAEVMRLFPKVIPTGVEHGTVTVVLGGEHVEVTTFRGEGEYRDGRRPSSVTFHEDLEGDLERRDFTMNALAFDPVGREFRDPFGGRADMRDRLIRAVGDPGTRFGEDGLRPLRAARFAAQLGYALDPETRDAVPGALEVVRKVSAERVCQELSRLAVAPHVAGGLEVLAGTGLLEVVLPELVELEPDLRAHAFAAAAEAPPELALRLAALLHVVEPERVRGCLARLRFAKRLAEAVAQLVAEQRCLELGPPGAAEAAGSDPALRRLLSRIGVEQAEALAELWRADARSSSRAHAAAGLLSSYRRRLARVLAAKPPLSAGELALDGASIMKELGIPPGREIGQAVRHLLDHVLEDPKRNTRTRLAAELAAWWEARRTGDA